MRRVQTRRWKVDKKFYVTAKFTAKKTRVTDMITLLKKLTAETKSEAGCLDYGYYQSSEDSRVFTSIEVWKNHEAEAAHWDTQHLQDALTQLHNLMDGEAEVTKYHKIT
ncbi:MAG: putative quinol monooxygenase [Cyanobacteria bacterium J06623_1]